MKKIHKKAQHIFILFFICSILASGISTQVFAAETLQPLEGAATVKPDLEQAEHDSQAPDMVSMKEYGPDASENDSKEEENQTAQKWRKIYNIINEYADPAYYLEYPGYKESYKTKKLINAAKSITAGCKTQYEKIKAITQYVAGEVYYVHGSDSSAVYNDPEEVYKYKTAVCFGYASLVEALCTCAGIPCIRVDGMSQTATHQYNIVYDSGSKRWIFLDATWCSRNTYDSYTKEKIKRPVNLDYFDMPPEEAFGWVHNFMYIRGLVDKKYNAVHYTLTTSYKEGGEWEDLDKWYLSVAGARKRNVKVVPEIEGIPVREIKSDGEADSYRQLKIKTLDLSQTQIKTIGSSALGDCRELTSVKFPATLTKIESGAFAYCMKLKEIDLLNTKVSAIDDNAFYYCIGAKTIKLPSTLKKIGKYAFKGSESRPVQTKVITTLSQKQLKLPNGNAWIGRKVTLPGAYTIRFMGNGAESGKMSNLLCGRNVKVTLPANKFSRPGYQFLGWSKMKNGKGKLYKNKAQVLNLAKKNKTVKLYACWKKRNSHT